MRGPTILMTFSIPLLLASNVFIILLSKTLSKFIKKLEIIMILNQLKIGSSSSSIVIL